MLSKQPQVPVPLLQQQQDTAQDAGAAMPWG